MEALFALTWSCLMAVYFGISVCQRNNFVVSIWFPLLWCFLRILVWSWPEPRWRAWVQGYVMAGQNKKCLIRDFVVFPGQYGLIRSRANFGSARNRFFGPPKIYTPWGFILAGEIGQPMWHVSLVDSWSVQIHCSCVVLLVCARWVTGGLLFSFPKGFGDSPLVVLILPRVGFGRKPPSPLALTFFLRSLVRKSLAIGPDLQHNSTTQ